MVLDSAQMYELTVAPSRLSRLEEHLRECHGMYSTPRFYDLKAIHDGLHKTMRGLADHQHPCYPAPTTNPHNQRCGNELHTSL